MAQRTVVQLIDDLTGEETEDVTNVRFSFGGSDYEIDLNDENYAEFQKVMAPYMEKGRRIKKPRSAATGGGRTKAAVRNADTAKIREWAKEQGYDVSERGRVPASIREAYAKAH